MNLLVLHGPNVNLLGARPGDPTHWSLAALDAAIRKRAGELGVEVTILQTNHEGALVDALQGARGWAHGIILNPGALALYAWVLRDAIAAVRIPTAEVHLGDFKKPSILADVCATRVVGKGYDSYLEAIETLAEHERTTRPPKRGRTRAAAPPEAPKTIGRPAKAAAAASAVAAVSGSAGPKGKTLGKAAPAARGTGGNQVVITRAAVREKIGERLGGKLTPQALSSWARAQWLELQKGTPVESGQRQTLEEILQQLTIASHPFSTIKDDELVEMMTQLEG